MPLESSLEFVAVVSSDFSDPKRQLLDDGVDKIDGIGLGAALIDSQSLHPCYQS